MIQTRLRCTRHTSRHYIHKVLHFFWNRQEMVRLQPHGDGNLGTIEKDAIIKFSTWSTRFVCVYQKKVVPSNICLGFNLHTITSLLKPFCSPVRLSPAIGVMSGAHYQSSIQELLHLVATFAKCWTYYISRAIFSKSLNTLHSIISISLSSELEWMLMTE